MDQCSTLAVDSRETAADLVHSAIINPRKARANIAAVEAILFDGITAPLGGAMAKGTGTNG